MTPAPAASQPAARSWRSKRRRSSSAHASRACAHGDERRGAPRGAHACAAARTRQQRARVTAVSASAAMRALTPPHPLAGVRGTWRRPGARRGGGCGAAADDGHNDVRGCADVPRSLPPPPVPAWCCSQHTRCAVKQLPRASCAPSRQLLPPCATSQAACCPTASLRTPRRRTSAGSRRAPLWITPSRARCARRLRLSLREASSR
jgi:hypothetical protein